MDETVPTSGDIGPGTSLADDLAAAASPAPHPDAAVSTHPAATVPAAADDSTAKTEQPGPMPYDRHKAILENARKEHEATQRERDELRQAIEQIRRDPVTTLHELYQFLGGHPEYADRFKQWQQSVVYAQQAQASRPAPEDDPFAAFDEPTATALRRALDHHVQQAVSQIDQRLRPFEQRDVETRAQTEARQRASAAFQEAMQWDGFPDLRQDIYELMSKDGRYSLHGAYQKVYREKYLPGRDQKVREQVLAELKQKGAAATEHPGRAVAHTPKSLRDMPLEQVFEQLAPQHGL